MANRFVILAAPRSGSNMLCSLLHSHPDVLCHHELFNPDGIFYALPLRYSEFSPVNSLRQRDGAPMEFLERIWRKHMGNKWIGFKMTHKQNETIFDAVINDPGIKKIILERENGVKRYVSHLLAEKSGVWEDYEGEGKRRPGKVDVDLTKLRADILSNHGFYDEIHTRLQLTHQPYLALKYEELAKHQTHRTILNFMGLRYCRLKTRSRKQNPKDLSLKIKNYQSLLDQCDDEYLLTQLRDRST